MLLAGDYEAEQGMINSSYNTDGFKIYDGTTTITDESSSYFIFTDSSQNTTIESTDLIIADYTYYSWWK